MYRMLKEKGKENFNVTTSLGVLSCKLTVMCRPTFDPRNLTGTKKEKEIEDFLNFISPIRTNLTKFLSFKEQKVEIFLLF